jgi:hypothetical protein
VREGRHPYAVYEMLPEKTVNDRVVAEVTLCRLVR